MIIPRSPLRIPLAATVAFVLECALSAVAGLRITILRHSFAMTVRRCSRVHILVLECALSACWSRLISLV